MLLNERLVSAFSMDATPERLLRVAAKLFAEQGFAGASMRRIAAQADITQAAIYHHFANKQELYIAAVRFLHHEKIAGLNSIMQLQEAPRDKLRLLVVRLLDLFDADPDFRHIYFRELIEGDDSRLRELAEGVFAEFPQSLDRLWRELAPHMDSHLMMMSLAGLVLHHLEVRKLTPLMADGDVQKTQLPVLADHISQLLLKGVSSP
jgi:AcrR family transcriptional regulator